ncbi:MAG: helix-turn-helix transcriptional regulator [Alphaproteobacteria bacterium]|nr:helix-turn-helix transcriptional regulator [Alphaproteobacteria bacterium]
MPFNLEHNHPTLQLKDQIENVCQSFLDSHNLSYFQFLRCYDDGSFSLLINKTEAFLYFLENDFPILSSFQEEHTRYASYTFTWDEELPFLPVQIVKEKFDMHHGITLVKRQKNFYDMVGFAMKSTRSNPMSYYFNHLKTMENFGDDFLRKNSKQVKIVENKKILPPIHMQDKNHKKMCLPNKSSKCQVKGFNGPTYLTHQEIFCLQLLNEGKSYKQIAEHLSISSRTVETYFNRIKDRTGSSSSTDLTKLLAACP